MQGDKCGHLCSMWYFFPPVELFISFLATAAMKYRSTVKTWSASRYKTVYKQSLHSYMPSPHSRGQKEHRLAFYVPLLNENLLLLNHKCSCNEAGYLKGEKNHHFTENNRHYLQPETRPGRGFSRKACKNQDWFTSLPPGLLQNRPTPYPTVGLQTAPEGWAVRAHEPQRGERTGLWKRKREKSE